MADGNRGRRAQVKAGHSCGHTFAGCKAWSAPGSRGPGVALGVTLPSLLFLLSAHAPAKTTLPRKRTHVADGQLPVASCLIIRLSPPRRVGGHAHMSQLRGLSART